MINGNFHVGRLKFLSPYFVMTSFKNRVHDFTDSSVKLRHLANKLSHFIELIGLNVFDLKKKKNVRIKNNLNLNLR